MLRSVGRSADRRWFVYRLTRFVLSLILTCVPYVALLT